MGSASIGVQPDATGFPNRSIRTASYSNDLVTLEQKKGVSLALTEIGCSGETTSTMLFGGNKWYVAPDSQLAEAISFLSAHRDDTGLVTGCDLGFNDLKRCLHDLSRSDSTCVSASWPNCDNNSR